MRQQLVLSALILTALGATFGCNRSAAPTTSSNPAPAPQGGGAPAEGSGDAAAGGQMPAGWVKVTMPEGPCTAWFPVKPQRSEEDIREASRGEADKGILYIADKDGIRYVVNLVGVTPAQRQKSAQRNPDDALEESLNGPAIAGAKLVEKRPIKLGKYPGLEYELRHTARYSRHRTYQNEVPFEISVGSSNRDDLKSADAERFLSSFAFAGIATSRDETAGTQKMPAGWVKVTIPEGPCEVVMPREPSKEIEPGEVVQYMYGVKINSNFGYRVVCAVQKNAKQVAIDKGDAEAHLKSHRDHSLQSIEKTNPGAKLVSDKAITYAGYPGREWQLEVAGGKGLLRYRLYLIADRRYMLNVVGSPEEVRSSDAEAFFDSFKLLKGEPKFDEPKKGSDTSPKKTGEWVALFNGKDLDGWEVYPSGTGAWKVENGILIGSGPPSHLFTKRDDYQNFRFRVEAAINDGGNSGQYFRTKFGTGFPSGYEAQINSTHRDPVKTGSLFGFGPKATVKEMLVKPDEWFTQEVIAEGNHIVIKVNDKVTVDFVDGSNTYRMGRFALQNHHQGNVVRFRRIEVQELP